MIKIPDSLWNSFLYAGLLTGACLRGAEVLVIAPAEANAPSAGLPQMIREWELMTRLLGARQALSGPIDDAGGKLRLGLYDVAPDQQGFASRVQTWNEQVAETPFLTELMPFLPTSWPVVVAGAMPAAQAGTNRPKLHQKVQYLGTRALWDGDLPVRRSGLTSWRRIRNIARPPITPITTRPRRFRSPRSCRRSPGRSMRIRAVCSGAASYVMMGSQNQDYRGMFMDGEVDLLFSGPGSLVPLIDLIFLEGTTTWLTSQQELDSLVPPPTEYWRRWARVLKDGV